LEDQEKLLSKNTPLFVQFYLGQNLLVESRHRKKEDVDNEEESNWKKKKVWMNNFAQRVVLERFNSMTNLFASGSDLDDYGKMISQLKGLAELVTPEQMAILTYTLVFNSSQSDDFVMKHLDEIFDKFVRNCDDCLTRSNLCTILKSMADFFTDNLDCMKNEKPSP